MKFNGNFPLSFDFFLFLSSFSLWFRTLMTGMRKNRQIPAIKRRLRREAPSRFRFHLVIGEMSRLNVRIFARRVSRHFRCFSLRNFLLLLLQMTSKFSSAPPRAQARKVSKSYFNFFLFQINKKKKETNKDLFFFYK